MGKELTLPKNIRQIGDIQGKEKIFLEDYVMTYIKKKEDQEKTGYLGIFLGERQETEEADYMFIRGILEVPDEMTGDTEGNEQQKNAMERLEKEYQEFFPDWSVQGCCVIGQYPTEKMKVLSEKIPEAGSLIYHLQEQEESIYRVEKGRYRQIKGYFVFYEQNRRMQEYMSSIFSKDSVEKEGGSDQAIRSFRKKVKEKGVQKNNHFMKLASSFFAVMVLLMGALLVNRIGELRSTRSLVNSWDTTRENEMFYVEDMEESVSEEINPEHTALEVLSNAPVVQETKMIETELAGSSAFWEENTDQETSAESEEVISEAAVLEPETAVSQEAVTEEMEEASQEVAVMRQTQAAYVIKAGDTLANICNQYYGNMNRLEEICELNGITDANRIMPGQKILLP